MASQFSALLLQLRLETGMTQERLAERAGVGVRTIRAFETGERTDPRVVTVRLLADALELTPDERDQLLTEATGAPITSEAVSTLVLPTGATSARRTLIDQPGVALQDALNEAADQLAQAVRSRWRREEELRRVQDPFPLPVRWHSAPEDLTDHWANVRRAPAGTASGPLALAGQLGKVMDVYGRIPSGRLVVLGRAGSGKTILALRFVLDMLATRARTDPVPVIFSLGSWDPTTTTLRDWLASQLVRDYPGLAATAPNGSTLAAALVEAERILPVLDGFDEIAHGLHRTALGALNATYLPLVLTSRAAEYAAAVAGTDVLTAGAVIELVDLTLADVVDYLPRTTRRVSSGATTTATVWDPVLTELRGHPHSPATVNLAAVLSTPLMVMLARAIYSDAPDRDPSELLDTNRFGTPDALEDHLLGSFIPTVYRYQPEHRLAGHRRVRDPQHAQRWLSYLAQHLDQLGTRDIAWWQLGTTMRRVSRMLVVGLVSGLAFGLASGLMVALGHWLEVTPADGLGHGFMAGLIDGLLSGLTYGLVAGLAFGLAHGVGLMFGGAAFEPSRVGLGIPGRATRLRGRFIPRLAGGVVFGVVLGFAGGLMGGLGVGLMGGLVFGLVWGLMAGLDAPLDIRSAVSPSDLLNTNRTTVVVQMLVPGLVFGLVIGLTQGLWFGLVLGPAVGLGLGLGLTAWGQWVALSRVWLPLTGRLPWAVVAFLDEACQRGVLRRSGAVYQFRHARLQDHLTHAFQPHRDRGGLGADFVDLATVPVTIYLSDEAAHQQVEAAVEELLASA